MVSAVPVTDNKNVIRIPGVCHIGISNHSLVYVVGELFIPKGKPKIPKFVDYKMFKQRMLIPGK